jgi:hypothetical protein
MAEQMMKLETMMATLSPTSQKPQAKLKVKDEDKPKGDDNKNNKFVWRFNRNMGGYCHSCGYHPVGRIHTSKTCKTKKEGHDDDATWTNHGPKGSKSWPIKKRVTDKDREHATYKNKEAPAN